jgi:hypothetical protein
MIGLFALLAFSTSTLLSLTFSFTCSTMVSCAFMSVIFAGMSVNCTVAISDSNVVISPSIVSISAPKFVTSVSNLVFSVSRGSFIAFLSLSFF